VLTARIIFGMNSIFCWRVGLILNFLITTWGDDVIPQLDDVTFLVKKRFYVFFSGANNLFEI